MAENYKILYENMKKMVEKYQDDIVPGLRRSIERLEAERQWISVEDRLPTEPTEYIVVIKGGASATTLLFDGSLWFEEDQDGWRTYYAVTHWMPIPQPPKGE